MAVYIVHSTFIFACVARKGLCTARTVNCFPFLCLRLLQVCTSKPTWLHIYLYIYILPSVDWAGCNLVHHPWQACFRSRAVATNSHHVNMSFRASHSSPLYANRPSLGKTRTQVGADCSFPFTCRMNLLGPNGFWTGSGGGGRGGART